MPSRKLAIRDGPNIWLRCSRHVKHSLVLQIKKEADDDSPLLHPHSLSSPPSHVSIRHVSVCTGTTRTCVSTCARGAGTHGDVSNGRIPHTTHHTALQNTTQHNTTQHETPHHTETEKEDRERLRGREKRKKTEREEKTKEREKRGRKRERREDEMEDERENEGEDETRQGLIDWWCILAGQQFLLSAN